MSKLGKGDIVFYDYGTRSIACVIGRIVEGDNAVVYNYVMSDLSDDVSIRERVIPLERLFRAQSSLINQTGLLMRLREKIMRDEDFFAFSY